MTKQDLEQARPALKPWSEVEEGDVVLFPNSDSAHCYREILAFPQYCTAYDLKHPDWLAEQVAKEGYKVGDEVDHPSAGRGKIGGFGWSKDVGLMFWYKGDPHCFRALSVCIKVEPEPEVPEFEAGDVVRSCVTDLIYVFTGRRNLLQLECVFPEDGKIIWVDSPPRKLGNMRDIEAAFEALAKQGMEVV